MEVLILFLRSQNKNELHNLDNSNIFSVDDNGKLYVDGKFVGKYKTKNRATEVFDNICAILQRCVTCDLYELPDE